jgi:hypothetical protein
MIFNKISWPDLLACSLVSKTWNGIIERSQRMQLVIIRLEDNSISTLQRSYRNLRVKVIRGGNNFDSPAQQTILENCRKITIDRVESYKAIVDFLPHCKNLKVLSIFNRGNFCREYYEELGTRSETFDLGHISRLTDVTISAWVADLPFDIPVPKTELRSLELHLVCIKDQAMSQLLKLSPHLQSLQIDVTVSNLTENAFTKEDGLGAVVQLNTLRVPAMLMNDEVIRKMQLPKLRHLTLYKQKVIC